MEFSNIKKPKAICVDGPIPITEYIALLNEGLKQFKAKIIGEVGEIKVSAKGHIYFSLKDPDNKGVIKCVIWKYNYQISGIDLKNGMEIIASGTPEIYAPWGAFNFKTDTIELVGEGALEKAYEELKKKLAKEGIFAESGKRQIPNYPQKIGVITSIHGDVIHDFTNNLGKFGFKVKIMDSRVEGQEAVKDLLSAIKSFNKRNIDVLVIMRGGGSRQSLMAFDNELLVREITNFPVPVIAGIGHHQNIPLVALAADAMASTPTATANILNKSWEQAHFKVRQDERFIIGKYNAALSGTKSNLERIFAIIDRGLIMIFDRYGDVENTLRASLSKIKYSLIIKRKTIGTRADLIIREFVRSLSVVKEKIKAVEEIMRFNNPRRQLDLGYSIVRHNSRIVRSIRDVEIGELLDLQIRDGIIKSKVKSKNK